MLIFLFWYLWDSLQENLIRSSPLIMASRRYIRISVKFFILFFFRISFLLIIVFPPVPISMEFAWRRANQQGPSFLFKKNAGLGFRFWPIFVMLLVLIVENSRKPIRTGFQFFFWFLSSVSFLRIIMIFCCGMRGTSRKPYQIGVMFFSLFCSQLQSCSYHIQYIRPLSILTRPNKVLKSLINRFSLS